MDTQNEPESRGLERIGLEEILDKQSKQQNDKEDKEKQLAKHLRSTAWAMRLIRSMTHIEKTSEKKFLWFLF